MFTHIFLLFFFSASVDGTSSLIMDYFGSWQSLAPLKSGGIILVVISISGILVLIYCHNFINRHCTVSTRGSRWYDCHIQHPVYASLTLLFLIMPSLFFNPLYSKMKKCQTVGKKCLLLIVKLLGLFHTGLLLKKTSSRKVTRSLRNGVIFHFEGLR